GRKLIGSAQKRIKKSFLQHGSIPLINDLNLLAGATFYPRDDLKSKIISLNQALGKKMNFSQAVNFLIQGFSEFFKTEFEPKIFNSKEMGQIYELQKNKYENKNWTFHF
ncbi:MAG: biotin/lipoate A/B protein ligase family protein, partial [Candidatus Aminicenantia bacterium]